MEWEIIWTSDEYVPVTCWCWHYTSRCQVSLVYTTSYLFRCDRVKREIFLKLITLVSVPGTNQFKAMTSILLEETMGAFDGVLNSWLTDYQWYFQPTASRGPLTYKCLSCLWFRFEWFNSSASQIDRALIPSKHSCLRTWSAIWTTIQCENVCKW